MKTTIANWGNYPVVESNELKPAFIDEAIHVARTNKNWIPRGNGRCYGDASLADQVVTTTGLSAFVSFDKRLGILCCEAGVTLDQVLNVVVPQGWFLPVTPGTKFITIGGAVASDVHGKNHHVDGSFSNHILEMEMITGDGEVVICGPQQNEDLFWATCGGMGLTGLILKVTFQLKKIETSYIKQRQIKAANLDEVIQLFIENKDYTYSVAWIDCLMKGRHFGRSILMLGEHATPNDLNEQQRKEPLKVFNKSLGTFPFFLPSFSLNRFTVSVFNALFYAKNTKRVIDNVIPYEPFFYPLDAIEKWNKMYGKRGFVQYQFVLPLSAKEGLVSILHKISERGFASFLAVLKIFGHQDTMIGFPMEGFTLALDIPIKNGLLEFLDELDAIVLSCGGRIYLSKDARMSSKTFHDSYPHLQKFREVVSRYNPNAEIQSALSSRLHLTTPK